MAKLIGFSENFRLTRPVFGINKLRSLETYPERDYVMNHDGPAWSIGYQREIRYFLDDGHSSISRTISKARYGSLRIISPATSMSSRAGSSKWRPKSNSWTSDKKEF